MIQSKEQEQIFWEQENRITEGLKETDNIEDNSGVVKDLIKDIVKPGEKKEESYFFFDN